jgi:hypothetical protein
MNNRQKRMRKYTRNTLNIRRKNRIDHIWLYWQLEMFELHTGGYLMSTKENTQSVILGLDEHICA